MPCSLHPWKKLKATAFYKLYKPAQNILAGMPELKARGDNFARTEIAPPDGIKKSSFSEAINTRGLEQTFHSSGM